MKLKTALTFLLLIPGLGWTEPYFAAWNGVNCNACHVNQTGGWIRNTFGKKYGNQLATFDWEGLENAAKDANKTLPLAISVGLDIHESYFGTFYQNPNPQYQVTNVNGFLSGPSGSLSNPLLPNGGRQALEIAVKPNTDLQGVFTYRLDSETTNEMYILWNNLPADGYLKLGKFTVPYGLELADDNSLIRTPLGFDFNSSPAQGLEGGFFADPTFLNFAIFNGDSASTEKSIAGKGGFQWDGWALAGSIYGQDLDLPTGTLRYGLYGWGRFSPVVLLAEYDMGYNGISSGIQDNIQAYHLSAEGDLGFDCYLRFATEWFWDSLATNPAQGLRHAVSFRCYPVHNLKFQLDLSRAVPTNGSSNYVAYGPTEDMVMADAYLFY
jgi:hypothetical protein